MGFFFSFLSAAAAAAFCFLTSTLVSFCFLVTVAGGFWLLGIEDRTEDLCRIVVSYSQDLPLHLGSEDSAP